MTAASTMPLQTGQVGPPPASAAMLTKRPKKKKPTDNHDTRGTSDIQPSSASILMRGKK